MAEKSKKILIADDDEELCMEIAEILRDEGYHTDTAFDGKSALKSIESEGYDLCILDIKMPHITGLEILRAVKSKKPAVRVVIATGSLNADRFLKKEKVAAGSQISVGDELKLADAVFSKPFDIDDLLSRIRVLLN